MSCSRSMTGMLNLSVPRTRVPGAAGSRAAFGAWGVLASGCAVGSSFVLPVFASVFAVMSACVWRSSHSSAGGVSPANGSPFTRFAFGMSASCCSANDAAFVRFAVVGWSSVPRSSMFFCRTPRDSSVSAKSAVSSLSLVCARIRGVFGSPALRAGRISPSASSSIFPLFVHL